MKLYRDRTGVIVGTQAEAKRMGKGWEQIEVPTDKQGLIDYLNAQLDGPQIIESSLPVEQFRELHAGLAGDDPIAPETLEGPDPFPLNPLTASPEMQWKQRTPRLFSAGPDNDAICEAIEAASGNSLARIGEAYVIRIKELTDLLG